MGFRAGAEVRPWGTRLGAGPGLLGAWGHGSLCNKCQPVGRDGAGGSRSQCHCGRLGCPWEPWFCVHVPTGGEGLPASLQPLSPLTPAAPGAVPPPLPAPLAPWQLLPWLFPSLQAQPQARMGKRLFPAPLWGWTGPGCSPVCEGVPLGCWGGRGDPSPWQTGASGRDSEAARPVPLGRAEEAMPRWTGHAGAPW